jgi:predicted dinucleotide-binding enzyme
VLRPNFPLIVGSGKIASMLARMLLPAGHEVWIADRRGPDSLQDLLAGLGREPTPPRLRRRLWRLTW